MTALSRFLVAVLVLTLAFAPIAIPSTAAQGDCDLATADCDLLEASSAAMMEAGSFYISDYNLNLQFRTDGETTALNTAGSGPVVYDDNNILVLDVSFDPSELRSSDGVLSGGGVLRANDDGFFLGIYEGEETSWFGVPITGSMNDLDINDLLGGMSMSLPAFNFFDLGEVSRGEDTEFNGETVAVFRANVELGELLRSAEIGSLLSDLIAGQLGDDQAIDPTFIAFFLNSVLDEFARELSESTITGTQYVSLDSNYITYLEFNVDLSLSFDFLRGLMDEVDEILPTGEIALVVDFDATLEQHGESFSAETPDSFEDISGEIEGLFNGLASLNLQDLTSGFDFGGAPSLSTNAPEAVAVIGTPTSGSLAPENPTDTYSVSLNSGDQVQIALRSSDIQALDPRVEIYGPDGQLQASNDDQIDNAPPRYELDYADSYLSYTANAAGEYVVVVSSIYNLNLAVDYTLFVDAAE